MHRRLFGASVLAAAFDALLPDEKGKELVLDYQAKNHPEIFRVVVLVPPDDLHGLGVSHRVVRGIPEADKTVWDVKRAWVLPDGSLELERYVLQYDASAKQFGLDFVCVAENGQWKTFTHTVNRWRLQVVDAMGNLVRERRSPR